MSRVDDYLEELAARLRLTPESARRLLEETEAHVHDLVEHELRAGVDETVAEERALARFGAPRLVARAANGGTWRIVGPGLKAVADLVAIGCAVVIAGTLLAEALSWMTSTAWVFGQTSSFAPSTGQISHWLQVQPGAHDWRQAAAMENASDSLVLRTTAAAVGLVAALALRTLCRRHPTLGGGIPPAVGLTAFGGAALLLLTGSLSTLDWGLGQRLCDALVALVAAMTYAVICSRSALVTNTRLSRAE